MHTGRIVFSQLMDFLPRHEFNRCVRRYHGNYRTRHFKCRDQFLCMAFAQLTGRESLRDIETCLRAMQPKLYHAGLRYPVSRSTLADANENRDWRIYADFAQVLIGHARKLYSQDDFGPTRRDRVCLRFQHHRSVSFAVSVGPIPSAQSRHQAPHVDGSTRQYPLFYSHYRGEDARCRLARRIDSGTGRLLHHGPRVHRLCAAVYLHAAGRVLCHPRQTQSGLYSAYVAPGRQKHRLAQRPRPSYCTDPGPHKTTPMSCAASATSTSRRRSGSYFSPTISSFPP